MSINVKNPDVTRLAAELVEFTGETLTEAIGKSIELRLETLKSDARRQGMSERLMEISRQAAPLWSKENRYKNFDDELYDEFGLPK